MNELRSVKMACVLMFSAAATACIFFSKSAPYTNSFEASGFVELARKHAQTLRPAVANNIRGDFSGTVVESPDFKATMFRQADKFVMKIVSSDREGEYSISGVLGSKRVEEYVTTMGDKIYTLPFVYDLEKQRWLSIRDVEPERKNAETDNLFANWNLECASCHLRVDDSKPANMSFAVIDSNTVLATCGACHSKDLTHAFLQIETLAADQKSSADLIKEHAELLQKSRNPNTLLAAREYQGLLNSVCFAKSKSDGTIASGERINCLSCHSFNDGLINVKTDEKILSMKACTDCHQQFSTAESVTQHTNHSLNSPGSNCYNCHMPEIAYGHLRFQRTHQIDSPNPRGTIEDGSPNACGLCHADKSVSWAVENYQRHWPRDHGR